MIYTRIRTKTHDDSIQLTLLTNAVNTTNGVKKGLVMMGTPANKLLFKEAGLYNETVESAQPNELVIAIAATNATVIEEVMAKVEAVLKKASPGMKNQDVQKIGKQADGVKKEYKSRYFALSLPVKRKMGKIHSVFAMSFNVKVAGQLFNFSSAGMSLSAYGCLLSRNMMEEIAHHSRPGDLVRVTAEAVTIYTAHKIFKIDLAEMEEVDLSIPTLTLPREKIVETGLFSALQSLSFQKEIGLEPAGKTQESFQILKNRPPRSKETLQQTVQYLIGRGKGLTPSGDDILIGYMMVRKAFQGSDEFEEIVQQSLQIRSTTDISQAFYRALFNGFVGSLFIRLISAVEEETLTEAKELTNRIVHYGHTSGYDTLFGFYLGLQSLVREKNEAKANNE